MIRLMRYASVALLAVGFPVRFSRAQNLTVQGLTTTQDLTATGTTTLQNAAINGTLSVQGAGIVPFAQVPTGSILAFAGATAPAGYLPCDGSRVSRTTYSALFAVIGTSFGQGDGSTTFNVPDLRGMFVRGKEGANVAFSAGAVNVTTDVVTVNGHGFNRSGVPVRFTTTGTLPAPLAVNTTYWIVWSDPNAFGVAASEANALAGTLVNITSQGTGTHTAVQWSDPEASNRTALAPGGQSGNSVGAKQEDEFQGHWHTTGNNTDNDVVGFFGGGGYGVTGGSAALAAAKARTPIADGTGVNGAPRAGTETRPRNVAINYIIKV